jgi:hypothetical protein
MNTTVEKKDVNSANGFSRNRIKNSMLLSAELMKSL